MVNGSARIIRGNALALPLTDASVDLIVTSPPYFGLRSYQDDGAHYAGQIGSEATPAEFVDALIAATREMVRALKPSGSIFVNLGDKYANKAGGVVTTGMVNGERSAGHAPDLRRGFREKSLLGIPWRYALRCIDTTAGVPVHIVREMVAAVYNGNLDPRACDEILREYENGGRDAGLGLILRAEIIWAKPNGLPESVTDRVRRSHEVWFHFTREPRYFSAVDEIREPQSEPQRSTGVLERHTKIGSGNINHHSGTQSRASTWGVEGERTYNPLGKLPGSVWTIPTQPLTVPPELGVDHFAAFPMEWPRRIIQGWSPAGVCTVCGEGRRPVTQLTAIPTQKTNNYRLEQSGMVNASAMGATGKTGRSKSEAVILGETCACDSDGFRTSAELPLPPTRPSTILDPFGGTGTTALVAKALGRIGISVDMSGDYSRLAAWRCNDPGQLAAALQVEKPDVVSPDQPDLFSEAL